MTTNNTHRAGTTVLELTVVLTMVGLVSGIAVPRFRQLRDQLAVHGAANDADALYAAARRRAIARVTRVSVSIDPSEATLSLVEGSDTLQQRAEGAVRGVAMRASRASTTYGPTGAALGGSNLTLILTKGIAAETLAVSRLGRVRR